MSTDLDASSLEGRRTKGAIYAVEHTASGRRLIGSTRNLCKRLYDQRQSLEGREHYNPSLNADLAASGPEAFRLVVLELVDDVTKLASLKRLHIEYAASTRGTYNPEPSKSRSRISVDPEAAKAVADQQRLASVAASKAALDRLSAVAKPPSSPFSKLR